MRTEPYLFFDGRCDEALAFYTEAIGAEVTMLMRYSDSPEPPPPGMTPSCGGAKVMHANVRVGETTFMASDGNCRGEPDFRGFSLSLTAEDEDGAMRAFAALAEGGQVQMPLGKTFFSPCFGMLTDRFGLGWMVIVPA